MEDREMNINTEEEEKEVAGESKAEKFKRIAAGRVNKALVAIQRLEPLSSNSYEYTEEQVNSMFDALYTALDTAKAKYSKSKKETNTFSF